MSLAAGTRLGPFEIVAPLGAGGMGEVYRARDSRLGRSVAIKVLPTGAAADRDRLARFEGEARRSLEFARSRLEELISTRPDADQAHGYHGALRIACAGLGLRDEAQRARNRGFEIMPETKDAWLALARGEDLAVIDTMLGLLDEAIDRLDILLSHASDLSGHALRVDPNWDPVRANPRVQTLLVKNGGQA